MHEVTHISYGDGRVDVELDSSSQTQVSAPNFRFGDYKAVVSSCFTQRELDKISEGNNAGITFYFAVTDEIEESILNEQFQNAIEKNEEVYGNLNEGIYIDVSAMKVIANEEETALLSCLEDVELQMDIPMFLVKEDRTYFFLMDEMGDYELLEDASPDADVLTVKTHTFTSGVLLYQDPSESLIQKDNKGFRIEVRHLLFLGIIVLIIPWLFIDHHHKKSF